LSETFPTPQRRRKGKGREGRGTRRKDEGGRRRHTEVRSDTENSSNWSKSRVNISHSATKTVFSFIDAFKKVWKTSHRRLDFKSAEVVSEIVRNRVGTNLRFGKVKVGLVVGVRVKRR
jgi:hypothetical protein